MTVLDVLETVVTLSLNFPFISRSVDPQEE